MLGLLKNYLDITWEDEGTDEKLAGILERARGILSDYAGTALSFEDRQEQQLLLDLCRYIWNHALEEFEENFRPQLLMLRAKYAVRRDADESSDG